MSLKRPTAVEKRELEFACAECGARPDKWCTSLTRKGWPTKTGLHVARFETATIAGRLPLS